MNVSTLSDMHNFWHKVLVLRFSPFDVHVCRLKVRGHCLMWAKDEKVPGWLVSKSAQEVQQNVDRRLTYMADYYGHRSVIQYI